MADDFQEKSEDATQKKLTDARKKGQIAKSQDLTAAIMLLGLVVVIFFSSSWIFQGLIHVFQGVFNHLHHPYDEPKELSEWAKQGVLYMAYLLAPVLAAAVFLGVFSNAIQSGFLFSTEPLKPKWKTLNIFNVSNYKKFFSLQALMKLIFGLGKLTVVGVVCYFMIYLLVEEAFTMMHGTAAQLVIFIAWNAFLIGVLIGLILLVLGVAEFIYQKWKFSQDMKMSKQEIKDERKQSEGDTQVKSKMRSMMQSFMQNRMKSNVPQADVVVANPIHFAIAIKYDADTMSAPLCVAKGARKMALAIKEIAKENEVPIVENPPLAQGLYKTVEVGQMVPPEFYQSIAEVLAYVYKMNEALKK